MLLIETGAILLALLLSVLFPGVARNWFAAVEEQGRKLAAHRGQSVALAGALALLLRLAVLPIEPVPKPIVHD